MAVPRSFSNSCPNRLKRFYENRLNTFLRDYGISSECIPYLMVLAGTDSCSLKELTERTGLDRAHTTRVMSKLIGRGYAVDTDPAGKSYAASLTAEGKALTEAIRRETAEVSASLLSCFTPEEQAQWDVLWNKMEDRIDELLRP